MSIKKWMSTLAIASLAGILLTSYIARGESVDMETQDNNLQKENTTQTNEQIQDYWTPERMRNAKPLMPTVTDTPNSSSPLDIKQPSSPINSGAGSAPIESIQPIQQ
ncbi:hypothetical protein [Dendronalium sp. ChiSLP03b]|uniref:hypothetical protein n=1 Tax=Dendronalium sp. ChiSLP03b TaxID=3075381 RepID=UPI002AD5047E|nr:hypothetical protein [Dendronalium sp. ChiSLP03b]MDZ8203598.1 hypothetical protein [Dendronalium sp. ChiSLP03b]